ncbi:hypothetical protein I5M27_12900 [Adhaeribacter sp. BT258]|uniref:Immunity protein 35 n=1 Tax=Adhaeribacter terrigena TaxID=2793070 RepID=A0ABS1C3A6_9BACT|nr:hypothetical protein [Adhaeribacter terrigena]MBK0403886.1 hypothetical protein [Adhaeribacter terrigena]
MKEIIAKLAALLKLIPDPKPAAEDPFEVLQSVDDNGVRWAFYRNKETGEIYTDAGNLAHMYGFKDQHEFLASDRGLDMIASAAKTSKNPLLKLTGNEDWLSKKPTE